MISDKMAKAINKQINAELYSAYLYFAMSAQAEHLGLKGAAKWLFVQGQEEMTHAWRFYNYVNAQGQHAILAAIDGPPTQFDSLTRMFQEVLAHEKKVTALIHGLVTLANSEKDYASQVMLQWFVNEQVEEEQNASEILGKLKMGGEQGGALFMIDKDLGARTFMMPPDLAGTAAQAAP